MKASNQGGSPLENFTDAQIADLEKSIDTLNREEEMIIKEQKEEEERKKSTKKSLRRLKQSSLEIINRTLFF